VLIAVPRIKIKRNINTSSDVSQQVERPNVQDNRQILIRKCM